MGAFAVRPHCHLAPAARAKGQGNLIRPSAHPEIRRVPALVAALLLPSAQPMLKRTPALKGPLLVSQAPARAQSAEVVAKVAQSITVRIEGVTQGTGLLVRRDGNSYTVLSAWHVVSGQRPGEGLEILTPDGQRHQLEQGRIKRLGEVDLAVLTFTGTSSYEVARAGDVKCVGSGSCVMYVVSRCRRQRCVVASGAF